MLQGAPPPVNIEFNSFKRPASRSKDNALAVEPSSLSSPTAYTLSPFPETVRKEGFEIPFKPNIQAATVYYKYWSEDVQKIFDKKGIRLYIYTVNDLKEAQYYMQEGAAGVCSDYLQDTMFN